MTKYDVRVEATIETNDPNYLDHLASMFLWQLRLEGDGDGTYSVEAVRE